MLKGVGVEQSESGVQSDGHPDAIAMPGQLADLAVLTRVSVKRLLQFKNTKNLNRSEMIEDLQALKTILKDHVTTAQFASGFCNL